MSGWLIVGGECQFGSFGVKDGDGIDIGLDGDSSERSKDSVFGHEVIVVDDQSFDAVLRNVSRVPRHFIDRDAIHVQRCFVATKDRLGNDLGVPMDTNVLSCLVKTHSKGHGGTFGTVKDTNDSMQELKDSLVVVNSMQLYPRWINDFKFAVVNRKV